MERDAEHNLLGTALDWLTSVLLTREGWEHKRSAYRRGTVPELDPVIGFIDRFIAQERRMPTWSQVSSRFKDLPWPDTPVPEEFASGELAAFYHRYDAVVLHNQLGQLLRSNKVAEAYQLISEFEHEPSHRRKLGQGLLDPELYVKDEKEVVALPSWGRVMNDVGIRRAEYALLAARTGVGKSWLLLMAAMDALEQGWDVLFFSLEMPRREVAQRMAMRLRTDTAIEWLESQEGFLSVVDQSDSARGNTAADIISSLERGTRTMIVIDYGELMRPDTGGRAVEGWNKSAEISQQLQNVAKHLEVPLLAAVQDNRAALASPESGVETFSGSDQWGRDADTALRVYDEFGAKPGLGPTRRLRLVKSRHSGARPDTYFRFDPEGPDGISVIDRVEYATWNAEVQ